MRTIAVAMMLSLVVGCASTRTYEVRLKNNSSEPITVGLTKLGGPFERVWASPEDAAINNADPSSRRWATVPSGRVADAGPFKGKFRRDSEAVLRIYKGDLDHNGRLDVPQILAVSHDQPDRADVVLHPGVNRLTVTDQDGRLVATREDAGPAPTVAVR